MNGLDAWVQTAAGRFPISAQRYTPDVTHPEGNRTLEDFTTEPWPTWRFLLADGTRLEQQLLVAGGRPLSLLAWRMLDGDGARLSVRPFFSGRDYHGLHHENGGFRFDPLREERALVWRMYDGVPPVAVLTNGEYRHDPRWYRSFLYEEERARGLDHVEDLASPGEIDYDLSRGEAVLVLAADAAGHALERGDEALRVAERLRATESMRRGAFASPLHRAADAYVVRRGSGRTIVAGYPWFTDWGRDTFIALRGLCLATGRLGEAREILLEWTGAVSEGMLPNRFPDGGDAPEYNSVDAALWFVVAVHDFLEAARARPGAASAADERLLTAAVLAILDGYARGTRHGIRADRDGLLACGEPGWQLTWMDARADGREVTPRIGKPVEVQALWLNALRIAAAWDDRLRAPHDAGRRAFAERFWNEQTAALFDVVDVDHVSGTTDAAFRPNQVLAVGGLPFPVLDGERARRMVEAVEHRLWTPMGLRSLAPGEPGYRGHCAGGAGERDAAYHQGTVWCWWAGPFVEAWLRVHGDTPAARAEARSRFVDPLLRHLDAAGLNHVSEIADGDPPHAPRGCPFQAWSVGELLRALALTGGRRMDVS